MLTPLYVSMIIQKFEWLSQREEAVSTALISTIFSLSRQTPISVNTFNKFRLDYYHYLLIFSLFYAEATDRKF